MKTPPAQPNFRATLQIFCLINFTCIWCPFSCHFPLPRGNQTFPNAFFPSSISMLTPWFSMCILQDLPAQVPPVLALLPQPGGNQQTEPDFFHQLCKGWQFSFNLNFSLYFSQSELSWVKPDFDGDLRMQEGAG